VTVDSPEELVAALERLLLDPAERARMGAAGRAWVRQEWDWDDLAVRWGRIVRGR
jgi:phosphatidylinositol alpha-1,6-mannosyltransferase